jgi:hypothetical protein
MKSKYLSLLLIAIIGFCLLNCATGGTFPIHLKYQSSREFPSLQQKLGTTLGIAPCKDERSDTLYIGRHTSFQGISSYFKSDPFPLEKAIEQSISNIISRHGVKTTFISDWDGKPESLKNLGMDSVLMIEIKRFWTEGRAAAFRTNVDTSIYLTIHLGVKKEGTIFSKKMYVDKKTTLARLTPERMEQMINQSLAEMFDSFLFEPYEPTSTKGSN